MTRALFALMLLAAGPASAQTVTPIFPASGPGGPYSIAIVADGFSDIADFNDAVNLLTVKLLNSEFYSANTNVLTIQSVFDASTGSRFHFSEMLGGPCQIAWASDTTTLIEGALGSLSPSLTVVLGNNDIGQYGCSTSDWMYVTSGTRFAGTVLPHELGHEIAGLFDEYVDDAGPYPTPPVNRANCSTQTPPYWSSFKIPPTMPLPTNPNGCSRYATGIKRPYENDCRMRDDSRTPHFCTVCEANMCVAAAKLLGRSPSEMCPIVPQAAPEAPTDLRIIKAAYLQPPPAPPLANQSVRLVIDLADTGAATVRVARDVTGPIVPRHSRLGDYVYAVTENDQIVSTGVFAGDPFEIRAFNGKAAPHDAQRARTASLVVQIPRATQQTLATRNVAIRFYRLAPAAGGAQDVTPDALRDMLQRDASRVSVVGTVSVDDLRKALQTTGRGRI